MSRLLNGGEQFEALRTTRSGDVPVVICTIEGKDYNGDEYSYFIVDAGGKNFACPSQGNLRTGYKVINHNKDTA